MNRAIRRNAERALRSGDPWAHKLYREWLGLTAAGVVDELGNVHCPDCGGEVERAEGWYMQFTCSCGWGLYDEEVAPW